MMTNNSPMQRQSYSLLCLLALIAVICAIATTTAVANGLTIHALERHGDEALLVRQCLQRNGAIQEWLQPNGRIARICQLENGKFGVEIIDDQGRNITAFIKNKMRTLEQVEQYMRNKGAELLWSR